MQITRDDYSRQAPFYHPLYFLQFGDLTTEIGKPSLDTLFEMLTNHSRIDGNENFGDSLLKVSLRKSSVSLDFVITISVRTDALNESSVLSLDPLRNAQGVASWTDH